MRGAYFISCSFHVCCGSVHPHVRGAYEEPQKTLNEENRFTPTCVGLMEQWPCGEKSNAGSPPRAWGLWVFVANRPSVCTVHPHVRGAYVLGFMICKQHYGSPPRAWGLYFPKALVCPLGAVHPHVRGAYASSNVISVPPLRFTPTCVGLMSDKQEVKFNGNRFTPTCVGLMSDANLHELL